MRKISILFTILAVSLFLTLNNSSFVYSQESTQNKTMTDAEMKNFEETMDKLIDDLQQLYYDILKELTPEQRQSLIKSMEEDIKERQKILEYYKQTIDDLNKNSISP